MCPSQPSIEIHSAWFHEHGRHAVAIFLNGAVELDFGAAATTFYYLCVMNWTTVSGIPEFAERRNLGARVPLPERNSQRNRRVSASRIFADSIPTWCGSAACGAQRTRLHDSGDGQASQRPELVLHCGLRALVGRHAGCAARIFEWDGAYEMGGAEVVHRAGFKIVSGV